MPLIEGMPVSQFECERAARIAVKGFPQRRKKWSRLRRCLKFQRQLRGDYEAFACTARTATKLLPLASD